MWLPPNVAGQLVDERRAYESEIAEAVQTLRDRLDFWNRELREIDPHLQLVKASENTNVEGLKPGYYHVLRSPPGFAPSLIVHEGPNGEFLEPDSGLFERLRKGDMWSDRSFKARRDTELAAAAQKQRNRERESEDRATEIIERWQAANRLQVKI